MLRVGVRAAAFPQLLPRSAGAPATSILSALRLQRRVPVQQQAEQAAQVSAIYRRVPVRAAAAEVPVLVLLAARVVLVVTAQAAVAVALLMELALPAQEALEVKGFVLSWSGNMRYVLYSTIPVSVRQEDGSMIDYPANTVVNVIVWDGVQYYNPGENLALAQSDTLQIFDLYTP